jgi:Fibronectin type III domain/Beta-propeller repeat
MRRRVSVGRSVALFGLGLLLLTPVLSAAQLNPPSLSAAAASTSQINLTWTDPNTSESGYQVERSLSSTTGFVLITTTAANVRSFSNTGLASSTTYYYRVRAIGNGNNTSPYSNVASARTLTPTSTIPTAPSGLLASAASSSQINLSWTDNSTNETGFKVERASSSAGPWTQIATTASRTFSSTGLAASTTYYFRVRAYNAYGDSGYTNTAYATTFSGTGSLPAAPSGLTATVASSTQINLAWVDNSTNESGFKLEVYTAATGWAQFTTVGANVRTYSSTLLSAGVTYSYRVRAYNTSGDSAYSNTATATTTSGGTGGSGAFVWSTHFGGSVAGVDNAKPVGIVVDGTGASIVLGTLNGSVNFGGGSLTSAGGGDIYLVKYSSTGGYVWSKRFGGTSNEVPKGIAIDSSGNIVITGFFGGTVDFGGGALTGTSASGFVAKYSSAGAHVWSRRLSTGSVLDEGTAIGVDGAGNVIVAGGFYGTVNFGGGSLTSAGSEDIVLLKYNSAGAFLWSRKIGGASDEVVMSLAVDTTTGEFVTAGYFYGSVNFGGTTLTSAGGTDAFVARYNSSNGHVWSKRWGSTSDDKAFSVDVDGLGNVAVTGFFTNNVDFGGGPITNVGGVGSGDIFLVKLSPAGLYAWSKGFGSSLVANQYGYSVAFDGAGNVLLTGSIVALTSPYTIDFGGGALTGDGYSNAFIAKFGSGGTYTWAKRYLGGGGHAAGLGIAADTGNNVLSTGYYNNSISLGGTTLLSPGGTDAYLVKLGP